MARPLKSIWNFTNCIDCKKKIYTRVMQQEYPKESQRRERSNEEDYNAVTVPVKVDGGE